ncbi:MAG: hypothetical protein K6F84_02635 [Lachnospiraceae bacterium]|nr:hypothetical protein [Lachnospiraceae bacterium]
MDIACAMKTVQAYWDITNPSEEDDFIYTEALSYLIEETKDPKYMCEMGWFYCKKKRFDLEIKYLELAAESGYLPAMEELGYMWYYGQHGEKDYEKAFYYFSKGAQVDSGNGRLWCKYKLADMYRYGCAVKKNEDKYREMIEEAFEEVKNAKYLSEPFPEISLRLAGIRDNEGRQDEAVQLLKKAKRFMAERLSYDLFWGHIEVMGRIVRYLYTLTDYNPERGDYYDLFYLTENPGKYSIKRKGAKIVLDVLEENGEKAIGYQGKWFKSFEDFCMKAEIDGEKFTTIYDEFYNAEVIE